VVEERKARGEGRGRESERREESGQVGRMNGECRRRVMWEFDELCAFSSVWVFVLCVLVSCGGVHTRYSVCVWWLEARRLSESSPETDRK